MGAYEAVDRLCDVAVMLAELVREQAAVIAQADIPDEAKSQLAGKRETAGKELDAIQNGFYGT